MARLWQKNMASFSNGIYNDIHELIEAINIACKNVESHFYFEQQSASGGKVYISINCDEKCKMQHHINFSDNLLRMLGFSVAISNKNELYSRLSIRKPNSNETEEKIFLTHGFNKKTGQTRTVGYWSVEPTVCGVLYLIKCSYIAIFVRLI